MMIQPGAGRFRVCVIVLMTVAIAGLAGSGCSSAASPQDAGGTDAADGSQAEVDRSNPCDPALGPYPPVGTDNATYTEWTALTCLEDACLCTSAAGRAFVAALLACDAVSGGFWQPLGSTYLRVVGRSGGDCVVDVGSEVEGGVSLSRCTNPLPLTAWPGLARTDGAVFDGFLDHCEFVGSCCLLDGCPDPCSASGLDVPLCPPGAGTPCEP
jgi:hypothetical protein